LAARKGLGALSFSFVEPEQAKEWVDEYYALIASPECVPAGLTVNPQVAVVLPFMCHEDEQTAIDRGIDGAHFFGFSLAYYYVFGKHQPGATNIWDEFVAHRKEYGFARELISANEKPLSIKLLEQGLGSFRGAVGTPAQIAQLVERYERAGVDLVIFAAQAGPNQHEHICEGIELFAKTVLPRFAENACTRDAEKRERLAAAIEQALARRPTSRPKPRDYVVTPQGETGPAGTLRVYAAHQDGKEPAASKPQTRVGQAVLVWLVRGRSDKQLERMMPFLAPLIFKGMVRAFRPDRASGFSGEIEYILESNGKSRKWTVRVSDGKAIAKAGPANHPSMTLRMSAPTFMRVSAGILQPLTAALEKKLEVEGDLKLMTRLVEMFGGSSGY
jgi:putative sterol carrier protein